MSDKIKNAQFMFDNGYNCSQSVISSFQKELNLDLNLLLKMSSGFGGGVARNEEICGAVTGAVIALGIKFGKGEKSEFDNTQAYEKINELIQKFKEKHKTFICHELLCGIGCRMGDGKPAVKPDNYRNTICKDCISTTINLLETLL